MGRSSATKSKSLKPPRCEESWVLVGQRRGRIWLARAMARTSGAPSQVEFDGPAVLAREERRGDVIGFLHTHPSCAAVPSQRDLATMRAWVSAFGKPLLCLITGVEGLAGYRFDNDASSGERVLQAEQFSRNVIVILDE